MRFNLITLTVFIGMMSSAYAQENCKLVSEGTGYVTIESVTSDISNVHMTLKNTETEIRAVAESLDLEAFTIKSQNFNIYHRGMDTDRSKPLKGVYDMRGTIDFDFLPTEKAAPFFKALEDKNLRADISVNQELECEE